MENEKVCVCLRLKIPSGKPLRGTSLENPPVGNAADVPRWIIATYERFVGCHYPHELCAGLSESYILFVATVAGVIFWVSFGEHWGTRDTWRSFGVLTLGSFRATERVMEFLESNDDNRLRMARKALRPNVNRLSQELRSRPRRGAPKVHEPRLIRQMGPIRFQ